MLRGGSYQNLLGYRFGPGACLIPMNHDAGTRWVWSTQGNVRFLWKYRVVMWSSPKCLSCGFLRMNNLTGALADIAKD